MCGDPGGDGLQLRGEAADRREGRFLRQRVEDEAQDEGDDRPEEKATLAAVGPDGTQRHSGAAARAHAGHIAHEIAIAECGVRAGEIETPQAGLDCAAPRAREHVGAGTGRLVKQRVGEAGAMRLDLVAPRAFGLEFAYDLVMAVGGCLRRPQGIPASVRRFVKQRRIVDAARFAVERGIGGAGDCDRRFGAVGRVDSHDDHSRKSALRSAERLDRLNQTPQREGLACAAWARDRRQEWRLDLGRHAKLRQRLNDMRRLEHVGSVGRIGEEDRPGRGRGGHRRRRGEGRGAGPFPKTASEAARPEVSPRRLRPADELAPSR